MAYQIHHLSTATLCPAPHGLINRTSNWLTRDAFTTVGELVCHCLLIETNEGLVLVDTGFGVEDLQGQSIVDRLTRKSMGLKPDLTYSAVYQIKQLGYQPEEVRHIILTHLDPDHAGGIRDFPNAQIHVHQDEWIAGSTPMTLTEKYRYKSKLWQHNPNWVTHNSTGENWYGFGATKVLNEALYDILLIPLRGHSRGHSGVAISTNEGWLLHCGDAYFHHEELDATAPSCPPALQLLQHTLATDNASRLYNQKRLRELKQSKGKEVTLICSHDPHEFHSCCESTHV